MTIEMDGIILARIGRGKTILLPLKPGYNEFNIYRNRRDRSIASLYVQENMEAYLWFVPGDDPSSRLTQVKSGDPLPEAELMESYKSLRNSMVILSLASLPMCTFLIAWALQRMGLV